MKGLTNSMPKPACGIIEKPAVQQGAFLEFDRNCAPGIYRFGGFGRAENVKGVGGQTTVDIRVAAGGVDEGTRHKGVPLTELTVLPAAKDQTHDQSLQKHGPGCVLDVSSPSLPCAHTMPSCRVQACFFLEDGTTFYQYPVRSRQRGGRVYGVGPKALCILYGFGHRQNDASYSSTD